jgi:hypothetical protein
MATESLALYLMTLSTAFLDTRISVSMSCCADASEIPAADSIANAASTTFFAMFFTSFKPLLKHYFEHSKYLRIFAFSICKDKIIYAN